MITDTQVVERGLKKKNRKNLNPHERIDNPRNEKQIL